MFNNRISFKNIVVGILILLIHQSSLSQQNSYSSSEILLSLKKLNVLGSVLYIAAHPDDENTSVLTYMSKKKLLNTAYLSLTRGDGGQNLLGSEKSDLLGVIRTQELLSARRIDGADQYFSRAIDFGYSKTPEETLKKWNKKKVLSDVVKVIREVKPDIIITRFSKTQGGHGHHLSSAILAEEAFYAAADSTQFSEQLESLDVWKAKRLLWNTWQPTSKALSIDVGEFSKVIGKSFNELSAKSRSMHKSQGFGVRASRGTRLEYFEFFAGDTAKNNIYDDIDFTWKRVVGGNNIEQKIEKIINNFDSENPNLIVDDLVNLYKDLNDLDGFYIEKKKEEIKNLIKMCTGLWMEAYVWKYELSKGEEFDVRTMIVNRSNIDITLNRIETNYSNKTQELNKNLLYNKPISRKILNVISSTSEYSQPYWLNNNHDGNMFSVNKQSLIGTAQNGNVITARFFLLINDLNLEYNIPVIYQWTDAVKGEMFRPIVVRPELSIAIIRENYLFISDETKEINVTIEARIKEAEGKVALDLPNGWKSDIDTFQFSFDDVGERETFTFKISANENAKSDKILAKAIMNEKTYSKEIVEIDYSHIPIQTVLRNAEASLLKLDINIIPKKIAYIMGSGDEIPLALSQLGYEIDLLNEKEIEDNNLSDYDVIICGIRAFNTREELGRQQKSIIKFVENGGTWIVQHNTRFGKQVEKIGPYKFTTTGRDRISEEDAVLEMLIPEHQIFNSPNKITKKDFDGWIQERGLYFADSWEGTLYPLLAGNDKGESSKLGGLLYTNYGKGVFIFTAYSWFRQIPAGVPGAIKLFVNMISAKGNNGKD